MFKSAIPLAKMYSKQERNLIYTTWSNLNLITTSAEILLEFPNSIVNSNHFNELKHNISEIILSQYETTTDIYLNNDIHSSIIYSYQLDKLLNYVTLMTVHLKKSVKSIEVFVKSLAKILYRIYNLDGKTYKIFGESLVQLISPSMSFECQIVFNRFITDILNILIHYSKDITIDNYPKIDRTPTTNSTTSSFVSEDTSMLSLKTTTTNEKIDFEEQDEIQISKKYPISINTNEDTETVSTITESTNFVNDPDYQDDSFDYLNSFGFSQQETLTNNDDFDTMSIHSASTRNYKLLKLKKKKSVGQLPRSHSLKRQMTKTLKDKDTCIIM